MMMMMMMMMLLLQCVEEGPYLTKPILGEIGAWENRRMGCQENDGFLEGSLRCLDGTICNSQSKRFCQ